MHERIAPGSGLGTVRALRKSGGRAEESCGDGGAAPCAWQVGGAREVGAAWSGELALARPAAARSAPPIAGAENM